MYCYEGSASSSAPEWRSWGPSSFHELLSPSSLAIGHVGGYFVMGFELLRTNPTTDPNNSNFFMYMLSENIYINTIALDCVKTPLNTADAECVATV